MEAGGVRAGGKGWKVEAGGWRWRLESQTLRYLVPKLCLGTDLSDALRRRSGPGERRRFGQWFPSELGNEDVFYFLWLKSYLITQREKS